MISRLALLSVLGVLVSGCIDTSGLVFGGDGGSGDGGSGTGTAGGGQGGSGQGAGGQGGIGGDGGSTGEGGSTPSGDYAAVVLADGPIGYWPLDSFANEIVTEDASGNGWDAYRAMGGATVDVRTGQMGSAVALSEQENLFVDGAHPFGFADSNYTLEAWVRVEGAQVSAGLWQCQPMGGEGYSTFVNTTMISHKRYDAATSLAHDMSAGLVGDFRHVVVVYDGTNTQWYLDGQPGTAPQPTSIDWMPQTAPFLLAKGAFQAGEIIVVDEVAVYAEVLESARIQAHYECGANGQCD
jgi:hypothetical protein